MIRVKVFKNKKGNIYGFNVEGHADFAENGADIVCSAVSVLTINTVNSIELFSDERFDGEIDEEDGGFLKMILPDVKNENTNHDVELILKVMFNGLIDIKKEYSRYISITEEVC